MEQLVKSLKRPIWQDGGVSAVAMGRHTIEQIIPHRPPFLLIDKISAFDISKRLIKGERYLSEDDPIFLGHFPGRPLYPGVLQIEMMAQLGLCLYYFIINDTDQVKESNRSVMAMVTKVHHASFHMGISPAQHLSIYSKLVDFNAITGIIAGQIFCKEKLCSTSILEAYLNE